MYTEEKRRGGLLREFIMKLILIIIFVLLLIWLVPWPNMNALNPLKDQIFNANLQTMKEAGISYFTTERLPVEIGDKTTLTLQKMLDMKLLVPFTDRNGNSCDVTKSYVSLEKQETEYLMKVNLKCGEEEDYILVHLGCYSYCTSAICEAKPNNTEKPTTTPKATQTSTDNITKPTPTDSNPVRPTMTYSCREINGKYWGKNRTVVDKATYESECITPTQPAPTSDPVKETYSCKIVDNEYWGVNKTVVDKATYEKECNAPVTPVIKCSVVNGVYYDNSGNVTNEANYNNVCNINIVVNPTPTSTPTITPTPTPVSTKEFEYLKTVTTTTTHKDEYTDWSAWTTYTLKSGQTIPKSTQTMYVEDLGLQRVAIGTKSAVYANIYEEHNEMMKTSTVTYKLCTGYNYVADVNTVYKVLSDWAYTNEYKSGFRADIPYDTLDTRWVLQSVDFDKCEDTCTSHPYATYRKMTRKISVTTEYTNIEASCANWEEKSVDVYASVPVGKYYTVLKTPAQTIYGNIHQYRIKTRTLIKPSYTETTTSSDYKWSSYNDSTLLNSGYYYTGKTRTK